MRHELRKGNSIRNVSGQITMWKKNNMGCKMRILESQIPEKEQTFLSENILINFNSTGSSIIRLLLHKIRIIFFTEKGIWRRTKQG